MILMNRATSPPNPRVYRIGIPEEGRSATRKVLGRRGTKNPAGDSRKLTQGN